MTEVTLTLNGVDISAADVQIEYIQPQDPMQMEEKGHVEIDHAVICDPKHSDDLIESLSHTDSVSNNS